MDLVKTQHFPRYSTISVNSNFKILKYQISFTLKHEKKKKPLPVKATACLNLSSGLGLGSFHHGFKAFTRELKSVLIKYRAGKSVSY